MDVAFASHHDPSDDSDLPPVPPRILSRSGAVVETLPSIWRLISTSQAGRKYLLDWDLLNQWGDTLLLSRRARHLLQLYLADRIIQKAASTVKVDYTFMTCFVRWIATHATAQAVKADFQYFNWSDFTEGLARAFLEWGMKHTAEKGNSFACLRAFYRWGVARGHPDFSWETWRQLQSIKVVGNAKGHHVRFRHPVKGPFSSDELFQIRNTLQQQKGTDQDRALVMLHLELGLNPHASVQITNADLKRYEHEHLVEYQIDVPRVKKRTVYREAKRRPISNNLGQLLERLQQGAPGDLLLHWLPPGTPEEAIWRAMHRFAKAAGIVSPHTHTFLNMTPRRFRTSLATHMAAQGASNFHIAEVLDHTDLQQVGVYTQTTSSIADPVATATDPIVQPLVQRFLGKIADSAQTHADQKTSQQIIPAFAPHLPLSMLNTGGVGSCGKKDGICRLLPPFSCYLCPSFVAFRHGPHQEMLSALLTFLQSEERLVDERIKRQLDDVCLAISEVLVQVRTSSPPQSLKNETT